MFFSILDYAVGLAGCASRVDAKRHAGSRKTEPISVFCCFPSLGLARVERGSLVRDLSPEGGLNVVAAAV